MDQNYHKDTCNFIMKKFTKNKHQYLAMNAAQQAS